VQDKVPAGSVALVEMLAIGPNPVESRRDARYRWCFDLATTRGRTYVMCADSESDMIAWIEYLETLIRTKQVRPRGCSQGPRQASEKKRACKTHCPLPSHAHTHTLSLSLSLSLCLSLSLLCVRSVNLSICIYDSARFRR
jgi:hypothetical protein